MEFIFEMMFQFLGEMLLQMLFEAIAELGFHGLKDTLRKPRNPALSIISFVIWGSLAGAVSLLIFPKLAITSIFFRKVNLIATPLAVGGIMAIIGQLRERRGTSLVRLDRCGYAFVFAFAMATVRFLGAR